MTMMKLCCSTAVIYSTSPGVAQGVADEEEEKVGQLRKVNKSADD